MYLARLKIYVAWRVIWGPIVRERCQILQMICGKMQISFINQAAIEIYAHWGVYVQVATGLIQIGSFSLKPQAPYVLLHALNTARMDELEPMVQDPCCIP